MIDINSNFKVFDIFESFNFLFTGFMKTVMNLFFFKNISFAINMGKLLQDTDVVINELKG